MAPLVYVHLIGKALMCLFCHETKDNSSLSGDPESYDSDLGRQRRRRRSALFWWGCGNGSPARTYEGERPAGLVAIVYIPAMVPGAGGSFESHVEELGDTTGKPARANFTRLCGISISSRIQDQSSC